MKKYQEKPIPLILRSQSKKYQVNPEALEFFSSLTGKVSVISVAGIYRTGKSFLLNRMILNHTQGFAVGPTTNAKTKGIWVWGKPLVCHTQQDEIVNVIVLDSQGLGSTEEDINHDLKLFSVTLLMSSAFLYNTVGSIDQNALDSLGLVLRLCEHLKTQSYNDFPDFYWILRDFSLALVDKDNNSISTKEYLQNCLNSQPGDSEVRNKIRNSIKQSFHTRKCVTFVRPLTDQGSLQKLDQMQLDQLRPQFVQEVLDFRKLIFQSIKTKTIKGKQVKGEMLSDLITLYVAEINGDSLPVIETGWKYVCQKECQNVVNQVQSKLNDAVEKEFYKLPETKADFKAKKDRITDSLVDYFKNKTKNNDHSQQSFDEVMHIIQRKMKKVQEEMKAKNIQQTKNFIRKQFESVQKKLKQSEFKSMGELVKQFEVFYEYYRKKCPYKDEIQVGLEYLLKKYSDCSLMVFKGMKSKKQTQIAQLRQQIEKLSSDLSTKEQKHKQQKQTSKDRIAVFESTISNLQNINRQNSATINQYEISIQKLNNQIEQLKAKNQEQIQVELLSYKKKIMVLQDNIRQIECSKGLEISNLINSSSLKDNQIKHLREEKLLLESKLQAIFIQMEELKTDRNNSVQQMSTEVDKLREQAEENKRTWNQNIKKKESTIQKLENSLRSKVSEIEQIKSLKLQESNQMLEIASKERDRLVSQYKRKINTLEQEKRSDQQNMSLQMKKLQQEVADKESDLKLAKMQTQKAKAIFDQKIQFSKGQIRQKEDKITKLTEQNNCYIGMFEQKDDQINELTSQLQNYKMTHESSSQEFSMKFSEMNDQLSQKSKELKLAERTIDKFEEDIQQYKLKIQNLEQSSNLSKDSDNQTIKQLRQKLSSEYKLLEQLKDKYEDQISTLKIQNQRNLEEQKRNAELSLIQLKNYYEMQKQRLEKKLLEDRKRFEQNESSVIQDLEQKIRKIQKAHNQVVIELNNNIEVLQDQKNRMQNEYEMRMGGMDEDIQNEKKIIQSRFEILEKKYNESIEQYNALESQTNQDRIAFIKKIEMLNFEISKKQKELMQANSKKQSADGQLAKKEAQIESIKKMMNQQIQNSLKKCQQTNLKCQKTNEQYLQFKIEADKELALLKQRNQFLDSKLKQMTKEREIGSSKNLEKADKNKIIELKEHIQKLKSELLNGQSKIQNMKKAHKQSENNYCKQVDTLQKDLQYQKQRLDLEKVKSSDLEAKNAQKNQNFKRQLDSIKEKYQNERIEAQKQIEQQKQKKTKLQDEVNSLSWKLQKQVALLNDKIQYAERQRDEAKKQLGQSEKRLHTLTNQLRRTSQKMPEDNESKKLSMDRRVTQQMETLKISMKARSQELQEENRRLKQDIKAMKDKNMELSQRVQKGQRGKQIEKALIKENQALLREKQELERKYRTQKFKEIQQWKRKLNESERNNKQLLSQNNTLGFQLEKNESKWNMEKSSLLDKLKSFQDQTQWHKSTNQLQRTSSKSRLDSSKRSDNSRYSNFK